MQRLVADILMSKSNTLKGTLSGNVIATASFFGLLYNNTISEAPNPLE